MMVLIAGNVIIDGTIDVVIVCVYLCTPIEILLFFSLFASRVVLVSWLLLLLVRLFLIS